MCEQVYYSYHDKNTAFLQKHLCFWEHKPTMKHRKSLEISQLIILSTNRTLSTEQGHLSNRNCCPTAEQVDPNAGDCRQSKAEEYLLYFRLMQAKQSWQISTKQKENTEQGRAEQRIQQNWTEKPGLKYKVNWRGDEVHVEQENKKGADRLGSHKEQGRANEAWSRAGVVYRNTEGKHRTNRKPKNPENTI